mmetsp:Transcript_16626/g.32203  ORF Transcript_16626/g.32203 Transcript_16626/m.32203 type:complete len:318 (+) Transcript_16626:94-1047(+)|eukprot:CAMPEP_0171540062 /NCGR_PEP_ID=MMETSP0960-20121227/976_1 /TAXON_ID=87120 /ORGANISM="Aurantiochytrium limacinum, Strain ATCCMYA-1381" /LENGTH=317 /DNA_ID=CAMNT_0012087197 /DNA_START=23 /DNA_END=976 /DNA_ORIENTATION=-
MRQARFWIQVSVAVAIILLSCVATIFSNEGRRLYTFPVGAWPLPFTRRSNTRFSSDRSNLLGPCRMEEQLASELSCEEFVERYLGQEPVVIRQLFKEANKAFLEDTSPNEFRKRYGHLPVKLSTANSFTGREWSETDLASYMDHMLHPQNETLSGNQTFYLFGSQQGAEWSSFLANYWRPSLKYPSESFMKDHIDSTSVCERLRWDSGIQQDELTSLSFGLAGSGTGVPFHFHGPGFLQMLHGRKRWFLYPPQTTPKFHPNETTLTWVRSVYPDLANADKPTHECVLGPSDVIYFPNSWMHATLNIDNYTAFIATFA